MTRFCLKPLTLTTWIALGVISQINTAQAADDFLIANTTNQTLIQTQEKVLNWFGVLIVHVVVIHLGRMRLKWITNLERTP